MDIDIRYILILILILIIIIYIIIYYKCRTIENFSNCNDTSLNCYKNNKDLWFHGEINKDCSIKNKFELNYYFDENNNSEKYNFLLHFMCLKTESIEHNIISKTGKWKKEYNNLLQIISDYVPCKSSKVYNLIEIADKYKISKNNLINHNIIEKVLMEDNKIMSGFNNDEYNENNDYTKLINNKDKIILGPVYILITQYPYKKRNDDLLVTSIDNIYHMKPFYSDKANDNTVVDVNVMLIYPMYDKKSINFYGHELKNYKCFNDYKINLNIKTEKEPTIKGIVDMIKFFKGKDPNIKMPIKIEPTKEDNCFINCVNNDYIYCGCASRTKDNTVYESICKEKITDENNNHIISNCLVYKLNENSITVSPYIKKLITIEDLEKKIPKLLIDLPCQGLKCISNNN
jgi:hypothetical protein